MTDEAEKAEQPTVEQIATKIAEENDIDILLYNGDIVRPFDQKLIDMCSRRNRRKNVMLILVTEGGNPHAAYRIARCLQSQYERFFAYIPGYCKSAGTLIVLGAHSVIMSDSGELGPLDIQIAKRDELWELMSGLDVKQGLKVLQETSFKMFEHYFLAIQDRSGGRITVKTSMEIATAMVSGLLTPIYRQIDPTRVGENDRQNQIGSDYGYRLLVYGRNLYDNAIEVLSTAYSSHGFVIDFNEVRTLFKQVYQPDPQLQQLTDLLEEKAIRPILSANGPEICFKSNEVSADEKKEQDLEGPLENKGGGEDDEGNIGERSIPYNDGASEDSESSDGAPTETIRGSVSSAPDA